MGETPERLPQLQNSRHAEQPAQQSVSFLNVKVPILLLKYLSNFWRSLDLPLMNCEAELDISRQKIMITLLMAF